MTRSLYLTVTAFVVLFCALSCAWSEQRAYKSSYDLGGQTLGGKWKTEGSAQVSVAGIDLTQSSWEFGSIWNEEPVDFSNWEVELDFEILRKRAHERHADGFGLFYVRDLKHGETFGTVPNFVGLGIVLDTYRNGVRSNIGPPFLQAHVLNGSVPHMWDQDGVSTALVNIHAPVLEKPNSKLIVKYQDDALAVTLKYRGDNVTEWSREEFQIRGVTLPQGYHFGIGAVCGRFCSKHRVLSLKVYSLHGPDNNLRKLPEDIPDEFSQGNEYVRWNTFDVGTISSSGVVLSYTTDAQPVFFAKVVVKGRTSPALYIPSVNEDTLYAFPDNQVTVVDAKGAKVLSHRYSRSSHLLWQPYPTDRLESVEFRKRLLAVGYSHQGDILNICRSEPQEAENPSERSSASGLGVFSISTGVCRYVNQIDREHLEVRTTQRFSMSFTLPTDAS